MLPTLDVSVVLVLLSLIRGINRVANSKERKNLQTLLLSKINSLFLVERRT